MKDVKSIVIVCLAFIVTVLVVWLVITKQNDKSAFYQSLYTQEQQKVEVRDKQIDSLQREKKAALSDAQKFKNESKRTLAIADNYSRKFQDYKEKYEALRDTTYLDTTCTEIEQVFEACDSVIDNCEKENWALRESNAQLDSANTRLQEAQGVTEQQFHLCLEQNESKDVQLHLQNKQLKSANTKTIAIGTVGGLLVLGGLSGMIWLAVH